MTYYFIILDTNKIFTQMLVDMNFHVHINKEKITLVNEC